MVNKIDSNITGLRYAEETSLRTLGVDPIFYPLEPNSYADFGGQISTVARNPINPSRQRKKGVITDLDASGGFNQDLTLNNTTRLLQGFFFADIREKKTTAPTNGTSTPVTSVTAGTKTYAAASGLTGFPSGTLIKASGFTASANNGIKTLASNSTTTSIVVTETVADESSIPTTAKIETVGFQFPSADVAVTISTGLPRLTATVTDMTSLGIIPGEWVFLGGDLTANTFAVSKGFARVAAVTATYIEFDKVSWVPTAEVGTGKTIRLFTGSVIKNEYDPALIKRRTYHVERTLGSDDVGVMSEYLVGAVANELSLNIATADKVTVDLSFVAVDNEQRTGTQGVKAGQRPSLATLDAFNTSNDFSRIKLSLVDETNAAITPLFAFATEITLTLNNNVTPNKAIAVLGAFDTSAGTFEVGGSMTVYFSDITAVQAVRNNADVTLDIVMVKKNAGIVWDIPLISLGDGQLAVEQDQAITLPLETNAAESKFQHTLLFQSFAYLPNAADL